ncbi:MAG: 16S rRNA (adenine(1518)-N(6)/adenine(1519)-N(6))-dimethyltransferase RsmA [Nakamurella sp.]
MVTGALDNLLGAGEIRRLAEEIGLRPTKTLGQNFVHDANTVRRIVDVSGVGVGDHVLEVGPGLGSLTLALVQAAGAVTAVEIDSRMADLLPTTARAHLGDAADRLTVVCADALRVKHDDIPMAQIAGQQTAPTALVANLPYNVSVPVLLHLLATLPSLNSILVMVQAEVADRLVAPPGSRTYGSPSVKLAWYGPARRAGSVSRAIFWPVPGVDSALVAWTRGLSPRTDVAARDVFAVVDAAFAQRRKTLRSALSRWAGSAPAAETVCRAAGVDPTARGESLDVAAFASLAAAGAALPVVAESGQGNSRRHPTPDRRDVRRDAPDETSDMQRSDIQQSDIQRTDIQRIDIEMGNEQ